MKKLRKRLVESILWFYARLTRWVPEGKFKKWVRLYSLNYKFFVFDEFSINWGETYVIIGTPQPKKILRLSQLVGPKGKVVLVEPSPPTLEKHRVMIAKKKLNNVILVPKAISDKKGKARFLLAKRSPGNRLVFDGVTVDIDYTSEDFFVDEIDVQVDTIDNVVKENNIKKIHFLELAINGAEMMALKGMKDSLHITERAYIKGHNINKETGNPLHIEQAEFLKPYGFNIKITKPSPSSATTINWGLRKGDIFAYR